MASPLERLPLLDLEPVSRIAEARIPSLFGAFTVTGFLERSSGKEHLAIQSGELHPAGRTPVRIHSECWTGDVLGSLRCDCRQQLHAGLERIAAHGGILLYLRQEGRGIGLLNKLKAYALQEQGLDTVEANHALGFPDDLRTYEAAAAMLRAFGLHRIQLLTNNPRKVAALVRSGLDVAREPHQFSSNPFNIHYLQTKAAKSGHLLDLG
ncbi:MAG TPA: GTP cyclohydrolase II [Holophagaceae bacterium]|jgi:GTP cyclohydrolase II|nr:GTP cyclohydrolase II [Holophagaceae bacterium]